MHRHVSILPGEISVNDKTWDSSPKIWVKWWELVVSIFQKHPGLETHKKHGERDKWSKKETGELLSVQSASLSSTPAMSGQLSTSLYERPQAKPQTIVMSAPSGEPTFPLISFTRSRKGQGRNEILLLRHFQSAPFQRRTQLEHLPVWCQVSMWNWFLSLWLNPSWRAVVRLGLCL